MRRLPSIIPEESNEMSLSNSNSKQEFFSSNDLKEKLKKISVE
jgi:hypothetical protein